MKIKNIQSKLNDILLTLQDELNSSLEGDHLDYILEYTQKVERAIFSIELSDLKNTNEN
jgi:hypothetical protein